MLERKYWHPRLTDAVDRECGASGAATALDDPGFCICCGHEQGGFEPDARRVKCEACGAKHVYGV